MIPLYFAHPEQQPHMVKQGSNIDPPGHCVRSSPSHWTSLQKSDFLVLLNARTIPGQPKVGKLLQLSCWHPASIKLVTIKSVQTDAGFIVVLK